MSEIWQTVLAIIGSIGGAGVIIYFLFKLLCNQIAERLAQKYQSKLDQALESYKSQLEKKNYISKARFDTEFSIFGKLSESFLAMTDAIYWLYPTALDRVPIDEESREKVYTQRYNDAQEALLNAQKTLDSNAPFIPAEFYKGFDEIRKLCMRQYNSYLWNGDLAQYIRPRRNLPERSAEDCYARTEEITKKKEALVEKLRAYLENLEVVEEQRSRPQKI